jgi:hypothetical protein
MASTTTYLQLVNNTILEAGCDLAFFASDGSDFDTSTNILHTRFKKWVKDAWRDIQQSAPDWHFSSYRRQLLLHPRIMWTGALSVNYSTSVPLVTFDVLPVNETAVLYSVDVTDAKIFAGGPLDGLTPEYATGFVELDGSEANALDQPLNVGSTKLSYSDLPDFLELTISGWGSYDFDESTQQVPAPPARDTSRRINPTTFRVAEYAGTVAEGVTSVAEVTVPFVSWETFQQQEMDLGSNAPGRPRYVTQDYEGRYRFFPAPDKDYLVIFDYEKGVQFLDEWDDVPEGIPEEFVELILWKALQYYGQFEELPSLSNTQNTGRADKQAKIMQMRMERQNRELAHFKPIRLY